MDILRIIISIFIIFFIPGFTLIQALFPRRNELDEEYDFLYRVILGITLSIVITTLDGFILGSFGINPNTGKGYWDTPYIFGSLFGISLILFIIGWYRGAYPLLGRRLHEEAPLEVPKKDREEFYKLMDEWKSHHKKLDKYNTLYIEDVKTNKEKHKAKINEIQEKLDTIESRLVELGHKEMPIIKAKEQEKDKSKKRK